MLGRAWCLALAALAACWSSRSSGPIAGTGAGPAVAKPALATMISSTGVGPLNARTPDDKDAIAALFPGLTVEMEQNEGEGHELHEYTIMQGDRRLLFVVMNRYRSDEADDRMFRIDVEDPRFATASGIAVGLTVGALAAKHPDTVCRFERYDPAADVYEVEHRLYCETPALPNVTFELDPEGWREEPARIAVARLANREIQEIVWRNPE